jgi:hypothetical protein
MIRSLVVGSNKRTSLLANDKQAIGELVMQVGTLAESVDRSVLLPRVLK